MAAVAGRERGSASRATLLHDVGYHVVSVLDRLATKAAVRTQLAFGHSRVAFQHGLCCNRGRTLQLSSRGRARNEEVVGENAEGIRSSRHWRRRPRCRSQQESGQEVESVHDDSIESDELMKIEIEWTTDRILWYKCFHQKFITARMTTYSYVIHIPGLHIHKFTTGIVPCGTVYRCRFTWL